MQSSSLIRCDILLSSAQEGTTGVVQFASYGPTGSTAGDQIRFVDGYSFPAAGTSQSFPVNNDLTRTFRFRMYTEDGESSSVT